MAKDFFKIGQAGAPKFTDIGAIVGKGLQEGFQPIFNILEARKKESEKTDGIVKQYLARIPNVDSISKIPSWMRPAAEKYLFEEKNKYNKLANKLAKMKSSDPAYMDTQGEMQRIVNNMTYFDDNLIAFQEESKDFVDLSDKGEISKGYKTGQSEEYAKAGSIFTGNTPLNIVGGELIFKDEKNKQDINFSQGQLKEFYKTDFDINTTLMKLEEKMKQDASRGYSWGQVENYYKAAISNALGSGGEERLYSMVYDKDAELVTGRGFETPEIVNFLNQKDTSKAREAIGKELETAFMSTYDGLRKTYLDSKKISGIGSADLTTAQRFTLQENKAKKKRLDETFTNAFSDFTKGKLKGGAFENIKTLLGSQVDVAPVDLERGIFNIRYKSQPSDPEFVSATINLNTEKSLRTLYDLAGLRENVDYIGLPINITQTGATGVGPATQQESRTEEINEDFFTSQ